jgi:hypothetical protein
MAGLNSLMEDREDESRFRESNNNMEVDGVDWVCLRVALTECSFLAIKFWGRNCIQLVHEGIMTHCACRRRNMMC